MRIYLAQDTTVKIKLAKLVKLLNAQCNYLEFTVFPTVFKAKDELITYPETQFKYLEQVKKESTVDGWLIVASATQYDNNFFFEGNTELLLVSFFGWKYLTSLPVENGLVYFLCSMLMDEVIPDLNVDHTKRTGCINDFIVDKTRVDDGMRKGHLCAACKAELKKRKLDKKQALLYKDILTVLKTLANASANNQNILGADSHISATHMRPPIPKTTGRKIKSTGNSIFLSYSHKDEKEKNKLEGHLTGLQKLGLISIWTDRKITPGDEWKGEIDQNIRSARIILLLISSHFIASDYCYDIEMKLALKRHKAKETTAIPIILRDCFWEQSPFSKLQVMPQDGKPIQKFARKDDAYAGIARAVAKIIANK